jgi:hypothetical protein
VWLEPQAAAAMEPMLGPDCAGALWAQDEAVVDMPGARACSRHGLRTVGGTLLANEPLRPLPKWRAGPGSRGHAVQASQGRCLRACSRGVERRIPGLPKEIATSVKPMKGEMIAPRAARVVAVFRVMSSGDGALRVPRRNQLLIRCDRRRRRFRIHGLPKARGSWLRSRADP